LINHSKIDFICKLFDLKLVEHYQYFAWIDFGIFKNPNIIPSRLLDIKRFNLNTINYPLLNSINIEDQSILHTLREAPEKIAGYFFFGRCDVLKQYQKLYHNKLDLFQNILHVADDDQHLALQCYFSNPNMFTLHNINEWHKIFLLFQDI
jgi:hypothetical protein